MLWAANEGKTLGWWPWGGANAAFELITDQIPDHPQIRELVHAYQERLGVMELAIDERLNGLTAIGPARSAHYASDASCTGCHPQAAAVHERSLHATAYESLVKRNYHRDPDCLRCHVTGLGQPDGFDRRKPDPAHGRVSCESCHGPGSAHNEARTSKHAGQGTLEPVTAAICVRCHDPDNSPKFDYATYWPRITH